MLGSIVTWRHRLVAPPYPPSTDGTGTTPLPTGTFPLPKTTASGLARSPPLPPVPHCELRDVVGVQPLTGAGALGRSDWSMQTCSRLL